MKQDLIKILVVTIIVLIIGWGIGTLLNKKTVQEEIPAPKNLQWDKAPAMQIDKNKTYTALIKTNKGDMTLELFAKDTPITVNNFVFLARQGFYDNVTFHRIVKDFMIQTGDPTGTGTGYPGYNFNDEKITKDYKKGIVAMANAGPNTNGSQFFIMHKDFALQKKYVIFGQITQGLDALDKIAATPVVDNGEGEISRPTETVYIKSITITEQ